MRRIIELFDQAVIREDRGETAIISSGGLVPGGRARVNIVAMGDVGSTVLLGLRLLGADCIDSLGIYDLNEAALRRFEREINQVAFPDARVMPVVKVLTDETVFDCDVFVFCATKAIPPIGADCDVRMAQFDANRGLVEFYARKAVAAGYEGLFAVVSDPVDPLCKAAALAGVDPSRIKGFGLGVMYARGLYAAGELGIEEEYRACGRAFGPHGADLVIANSIASYNHELSMELTMRAVTSNLVTRGDGFKPYIAPAMSSAAISILETIRGGWNYSSIYTGEVFLGCRNRLTEEGFELETIDMPDKLFERIDGACTRLLEIV